VIRAGSAFGVPGVNGVAAVSSEARLNKRCISIIPELTAGGWYKTADSKASPRERITAPESMHLISRRRITSSSFPARFQMAAHDFSDRVFLWSMIQTCPVTHSRSRHLEPINASEICPRIVLPELCSARHRTSKSKSYQLQTLYYAFATPVTTVPFVTVCRTCPHFSPPASMDSSHPCDIWIHAKDSDPLSRSGNDTIASAGTSARQTGK